jgi:hypothetical protein
MSNLILNIQRKYCWGSVPCIKKGQFDAICSHRKTKDKPTPRPYVEAAWFYWTHWDLGIHFENNGYGLHFDINLIRFRISFGWTTYTYSHVDTVKRVINTMELSGARYTDEQKAEMIAKAEKDDNIKWWQVWL